MCFATKRLFASVTHSSELFLTKALLTGMLFGICSAAVDLGCLDSSDHASLPTEHAYAVQQLCLPFVR